MGQPWNAHQIPDLGGRIAVVTGASSGLGWETALELARHGAHTVLACRDAGRGQSAVDRIRAAHPAAQVEVMALDLTRLASVREFATSYGERFARLDLLINNAGVMAVPRAETGDGFEMQLGTNHLGHFALTGLLLDRLCASGGARVVTVSSLGHWLGRFRFDDLQGKRSYGKLRAYFQSKLANVLFMRQLQHRVERAGLPLLSVGSHPGLASTNLGAGMVGKSSIGRFIVSWGNRLFAQSAAMGALGTLRAATAPEVRGGEYYGPRVLGIWGAPVRARSRHPDEAVARELWDRSVALTGVAYPELERAA